MKGLNVNKLRVPLVVVAVLVAMSIGVPLASASPLPAGADAASSSSTFSTAFNYAIRFYPRFMTYFQQKIAGLNRISGPATMGPEYGIVVAPNDDTVYGEFILNLSHGPEIFTLPFTGDTCSLLTLDIFGNVFRQRHPAPDRRDVRARPGGVAGSLPQGVKEITVPYTQSEWIIRADKFTPDGQNRVLEANTFRSSMRLASLAQYQADPSSGGRSVAPIAFFSPRMKAITDQAITQAPTSFFEELQRAMHSPTTRGLSLSDRQLSRRFDKQFAVALVDQAHGEYGPMSQIIGGAHAAHSMIVNNWLSHIGTTRWVYFGNIGEWGNAYLDRASVAEFLQFGNNASAATYYYAFTDRRGVPLDSSVTPVERLTFAANEIPQAKRFWSLTAYIPPGITLVPNSRTSTSWGATRPAWSRIRTARSRSTSSTIHLRARFRRTGCRRRTARTRCCSASTVRRATPRRATTTCRLRSSRTGSSEVTYARATSWVGLVRKQKNRSRRIDGASSSTSWRRHAACSRSGGRRHPEQRLPA